MASKVPASSFEQLKGEVTCQICHKVYSSPKLLPCLHAFCKGCLALKHGLRDKEGLKFTVDCPLCSETTELPKIGLDSLPDAHFKQRMTRLHSIVLVTEGKGNVECDQCHKPNSQATTCCSTCGLICEACLESHRVMKSFSDHSTIPIVGESLVPVMEALKTADDICVVKCEKHSSELVKMYCHSCKKLICVKCMVESHKQPDHKTEDVSNPARTKREELRQSMTQARTAHQELTERVKLTQRKQEELLKQSEVMKTLVTTNIQLLQEQLENLQAKFLSEIDSAVANHLAQLTDNVHKHSLKAEASGHLVKTGEQVLEHTSDIELLSLKRYMSNRLKELYPKKLSTDLKVDSATIEFPSGLSLEIMQLVTSHISHNLSPSLEASHAKGAGIRGAEVRKEASFIVHSLTDVGEPCIEEQAVEVEITVARTKEKVPVVLSKNTEIGTFNVKYIPTVKGEHKVAVRIEGNPIKRSPYSLIARGVVNPWLPTLVIDRQEWPWGVACSTEREIYVTRNYHHIVAIFSQEGKYLRKIGMKGQGPGSLFHPTGIAVGKDGSIYVADGKGNGRLQKFSSNGQLVAIYTKLRQPQGVLLNKDGDSLYVCDKGNRSVVLLDTNLEEKKVFGELDHYSEAEGFESVSGHLVAPHSAAEAENGTIFISDTQSIHIFTKDGEHLRIIEPPSGEFAPSGITIDGDQLYVCDMIKNCLLVFSTNGTFIGTKGGMGKHPGKFNTPTSLTVDCDGYLFVTDFSNSRVQVF